MLVTLIVTVAGWIGADDVTVWGSDFTQLFYTPATPKIRKHFFSGTTASITRSSLVTSVQQWEFAEVKEQTPGEQIPL